jgi:hypothetical protein
MFMARHEASMLRYATMSQLGHEELSLLSSVRQALRLLGRSPAVEWFEIAFIKRLSQRT